MTLREEWEAKLARPASRMVIPKAGALPDDTLSWFGRVTLAEPDSDWPTFEGRLLWPIIQIAPAEAPYVPDGLKDIALLQVFMHPEYGELWNEGEAIRAYTSLDGLESISEPDHGSEITPTAVRWEYVERDLPCARDLPDEIPAALREEWEWQDSPTIEATKLGGWPYVIQWSPCFPKQGRVSKFDYVWQIGSQRSLHWMWGDLGVAYIGRGRHKRDVWSLEWQCS